MGGGGGEWRDGAIVWEIAKYDAEYCLFLVIFPYYHIMIQIIYWNHNLLKIIIGLSMYWVNYF
jgi:hypothetical protein